MLTETNRGRIGTAIILIGLGLALFVIQFVPGLQELVFNGNNWFLIIIGVGVLFLIAALLTWTPGLMVPAALISGVGAIFTWQTATGNFESWAYIWTLFPGFVGVGVFLMNLMQGNFRQAVTAGGWLVLISGVMFLIFGSFLGGLGLLGQYWPLLLILIGVLILVQGFFRRA